MVRVDCEQGSEAWFGYKCGRITGTRFAKVVAAKGSATYKDLITDLAAEIITGEVEETFKSEHMDRGKDVEPKARQEYESIFELEVEEVGFCLPGSNLDQWVGISVDGLVGQDGGVEIKCPKKKTHINYIENNNLPNGYRWQVQGQLLYTGRKWWDFMSYYPGMKPFIYRVRPDIEMHSQLDREIRLAIKAVKAKIKMYDKYDFMQQPK